MTEDHQAIRGRKYIFRVTYAKDEEEPQVRCCRAAGGTRCSCWPCLAGCFPRLRLLQHKVGISAACCEVLQLSAILSLAEVLFLLLGLHKARLEAGLMMVVGRMCIAPLNTAPAFANMTCSARHRCCAAKCNIRSGAMTQSFAVLTAGSNACATRQQQCETSSTPAEGLT